MGNSNNAGAARSASSQSTQQEPEIQQVGYYQMIKSGYNDLVHAIIRPPRCRYEVNHLGPKIFDFAGKQFQRIDYELLNPRGLTIACSLWEPVTECRNDPILPCVIYMHGNSSARVEALTQLSLVLSMGATLVSFDFTGSGKSDGEWVSLGAYEKEDLKCVIEHLRGLGNTSTIALWGRSMGAATALLHGERDPSIAGMILDSAFADLQMLAEEMVEKGRQNGLFAPTFLVSIAIRLIRNTVQKTAGFDIKTLCPIAHADKCFIPALFVAAEGDEFVPPHHSQKIYQKYAGDLPTHHHTTLHHFSLLFSISRNLSHLAYFPTISFISLTSCNIGDKNIILVEGDHNSARPRFLFDSASIFLIHVLQIPNTWMLDNADAYRKSYGLPPWDNHNGSSSRRKPSSQSSSSTASSGNGKGTVTTKPSAVGTIYFIVVDRFQPLLHHRSSTIVSLAHFLPPSSLTPFYRYHTCCTCCMISLNRTNRL